MERGNTQKILSPSSQPQPTYEINYIRIRAYMHVYACLFYIFSLYKKTSFFMIGKSRRKFINEEKMEPKGQPKAYRKYTASTKRQKQ